MHVEPPQQLRKPVPFCVVNVKWMPTFDFFSAIRGESTKCFDKIVLVLRNIIIGSSVVDITSTLRDMSLDECLANFNLPSKVFQVSEFSFHVMF